jgi:uncharacterized RDD family membrane protein YckC
MQSFEPGSEHFKDNNPFSSMPLPSRGFEIGSEGNLPLASLAKRFIGMLYDQFIPILCMLPGLVMMFADSDIILAQSQEREPTQFGTFAIIGVIWMVIVGLVGLVLNIYLLATRSQSIGKYLIRTQIHAIETNQPANFVKTFLLRGVVNGLIAGVLGCIPFLGLVYQLVDACFIFREDRRCLHDLIAGTKVVDIS